MMIFGSRSAAFKGMPARGTESSANLPQLRVQTGIPLQSKGTIKAKSINILNGYTKPLQMTTPMEVSYDEDR
jgi:hypothetical protein